MMTENEGFTESLRKEGLFKANVATVVFGFIRIGFVGSIHFPLVLMGLIVKFLSTWDHRVFVKLRTERIWHVGLLSCEALSCRDILSLLDIRAYVLCFICFSILVWYVFVLYAEINGCY